MEVVFMKKIYKTVLLFLVCTSLFAQNANQSKEPITFESHDLRGAPLSEKLLIERVHQYQGGCFPRHYRYTGRKASR